MIKYLGHGRTRHAILFFNRYVVKVPLFRNIKEGVLSSLSEWKTWKQYQYDFLAPVIATIPGILVIMPYYPVRIGIKKPEGFHDKLKLIGITDLCAYNVGWDGDKPKAIDYGSIGACSLIFTYEIIANVKINRGSGWID